MSTLIQPTDRPLYWSLTYYDKVILADVCPIGGVVASPLTAYSNPDPNTFLNSVSGKASTYKPLPNVGEICEAETIYGYNGGLVICRQTHNRTIYPPEQTPALFIVYRADAASVLDWIVGEKVEVGMHRIYNTVEYVVVQAHVTQSDWTPDKTPTLWGAVAPATGVWAVGVAYKVGDLVTYQGSTYKCLQAHTSIATWTPTAAVSLWQKQ